MSRTVNAALVVLIFIAAGCGKTDPGRPAGDGDGVQVLPALQPETGGELALVPAGTFTMGDSAGRPDETPHTVSVNLFYLDRYPVTQELYEKVMGASL